MPTYFADPALNSVVEGSGQSESSSDFASVPTDSGPGLRVFRLDPHGAEAIPRAGTHQMNAI
ncbi:hypothetical protein GCM10027167_39380 [Nocardia heshunensis]